MKTIRINYDDNAETIVSAFSSLLSTYGLELVKLEDGDGFIEYEVKPLT